MPENLIYQSLNIKNNTFFKLFCKQMVVIGFSRTADQCHIKVNLINLIKTDKLKERHGFLLPPLSNQRAGVLI